jgi:hypothetical protein
MLSDIATEGLDAGSTEPHARYSTAGSIARRKFHMFVSGDAGLTP